MGFRRFLVRYVLGGVIVHKYADSVVDLERLLAVPRDAGIGWSFRSVA